MRKQLWDVPNPSGRALGCPQTQPHRRNSSPSNKSSGPTRGSIRARPPPHFGPVGGSNRGTRKQTAWTPQKDDYGGNLLTPMFERQPVVNVTRSLKPPAFVGPDVEPTQLFLGENWGASACKITSRGIIQALQIPSKIVGTLVPGSHNREWPMLPPQPLRMGASSQICGSNSRDNFQHLRKVRKGDDACRI